MSHTVMITTPAGNAMQGHGLTDARTILASDADLHPKRQGLSVTPRAVAYSVYCPATERYSLVTLDGRWIIPGREGYKTRGPVATYARKNLATVRPEGMRVLEPVRHEGRYAATRYGQRRSGICRAQVGYASRGTGYSCSCGASLMLNEIQRDGWTVVLDGRKGTHTVAYALRSSDAVEFGAEPCAYDAPVVTGAPQGAPAEPAARPEKAATVTGADIKTSSHLAG